MAFSKEIRIQELVASARHCCVCHRYKGVKVEVHHIIPKSQGGTDDADNAIALCFDCHSDAGHYNFKHPRGTKFSYEELKLARGMWHMAVRQNRIVPPEETDSLYCRYLVCKSFSAIREVSEGNLTTLPVESPFCAPTFVLEFQRYIMQSYPEPYRPPHIQGEYFSNQDFYKAAYPNVRILDRSSKNLFPYFEAIRIPSLNELRIKVSEKDTITSLLIKSGVPPVEISQVLAYNEVCGPNRFQEIYRIRPLWSIYLAASNITDRPIQLKALVCDLEEPSGVAFRFFSEEINPRREEIALPKAPIPPNATVIIPVATALGPINDKYTKLYWHESINVDTGEVQDVAHVNGSDLVAETALIGPALWPISLRVDTPGGDWQQQIHGLDLSNLYMIDRYWEVGCCPHLLLEVSHGDDLRYYGELFARAPNILQATELSIPTDVTAIVIVELEPECTHIVEVCVNGLIKIRNRVLCKNEYIWLPVEAGDRVRLTGYYEPLEGTENRKSDPWRKNMAIMDFMRSVT